MDPSRPWEEAVKATRTLTAIFGSAGVEFEAVNQSHAVVTQVRASTPSGHPVRVAHSVPATGTAEDAVASMSRALLNIFYSAGQDTGTAKERERVRGRINELLEL